MQCTSSDVPTNAYSECSVFPVTAFDDGHFAAKKRARAVENLVRVAMVATGMGMAYALVRMAVS